MDKYSQNMQSELAGFVKITGEAEQKYKNVLNYINKPEWDICDVPSQTNHQNSG